MSYFEDFPETVLQVPARAAAWPTTLGELEAAERFVVWMFRRWVVAAKNHDARQLDILAHEFRRQIGAAVSREGMMAAFELVNTIRNHARRMIEYHQPCCGCLGSDEACVLTLVAAGQSGDEALTAGATARWLVRDEGRDILVANATRLGVILADAALYLPQRGAGAVGPVPEAARLH
ncbi:MAG: hypothetical protein O3A96_09980 [Proteobacteria bacterium]|nr:hypothetical protein [Pseudomonadota bacterium]